MTSDLRKFRQAFIEAAAPELRAALHGRETDEERFREEFERQLRGRGVINDGE